VTIIDFDWETGIVEFQINTQSDYNVWFSKHIYKIIRDIYHSHIWTTGDFGIRPVNSDNKANAIKILWRKYYEKCIIIGYHQKLKQNICSIIERKLYHSASMLPLQLSCTALGELYYASNFCNINGLGEKEHIMTNNAIDSIKNLRQHYEDHLHNHRSKMTLMKISLYLLTFMATIGSAFSILKEFLPNSSALFYSGILCIIFVPLIGAKIVAKCTQNDL